jgi:hypothetical protein
MSKKIEVKDTVIEPILEVISGLIKKAKQNVWTSVNSELVLLYWNIGSKIKTDILKNEKGEYGKYVVTKLSEKLTIEFGKGYSRASLFRMIRFYEVFPDIQIVATLLRLLSWSHFIELIKIDDPLKRDFYIQICINEKWPVRTLQGRINSMLYERTAISKKPEKTIVTDLELLKKENKMIPDLTSRALALEKFDEKWRSKYPHLPSCRVCRVVVCHFSTHNTLRHVSASPCTYTLHSGTYALHFGA